MADTPTTSPSPEAPDDDAAHVPGREVRSTVRDAAGFPSNDVLDVLRSRRSVRVFSGEHVAEADLEAILLATRQAPMSINAEGLSLVVVRDPERIRAIAEIAGGQVQVAGADVVVVFVADFHRTGIASRNEGVEQVVQNMAEGVLVGAVDAGIALATFQTAAHSLGYGTTAIGGIRRAPDRLVELLDLPEHTFPVVASTLGIPDAAHLPLVKPRMPLASYAMDERYDADAVEEGTRTYDPELRAWWDAQGMEERGSWSHDTAAHYSRYYYPRVAATLRDQGFDFRDAPED